MHGRDIDIAILGGGLAGGLIALALARLRPELRLLLVEQGQTFGGNHIWSFFASDVAEEDAWLIEPLIAARWDQGYEVRFPRHARTLATPYRGVTSERLDAALRAALPREMLLTGVTVTEAGQDYAVVAGEMIRAGGVIDARGAAGLAHMAGGWQKFLGRMLRLDAPHGLDRPIVMDARVEQADGYRFVYCLPFSETEVFVEDTYYADGPQLDAPAVRDRIADYARAHGWRIAEVLREETGVLPVIATGDFAAFWPDPATATARAGARAALVHPLTSYSLPDAVRFARHIAGLGNLSGAALAKASYAWAGSHWRRRGFYRMLTRMLFGAAEPRHRYRLLERFYTLPEPLIERFYAGRSTPTDRLRILAGKPPVAIGAAIASLMGRGRPLAPLGAKA